MQIRRFAIAGMLICAAAAGGRAIAADNELTPSEKALGWELLFDGKTLNGWKTSGMQESRKPVEDGCINPHGSGHYMMIHERVWTDFVLSLDFKISKGCNSGIFLRTWPLDPLPGWDVGYNGIEVAIDDTTTAGYHDTGAIYDLAKPKRNAMKPVGEWNHIEIKCVQETIEVEVNGEAVTSMSLDEFDKPGRRADGIEHKFEFAYKDKPRFGYIGLQDHGSDCWHKNIKIKPMEPVFARLSGEGASGDFEWSAERAGEAIATIEARAPGADWGVAGREAPTLGVHLDGELKSHIVVSMGEEVHEYGAMLGEVGPGTHRVRFALEPDLCAAGAREVVIRSPKVEVVPPGGPRHAAIRNAPILYGRKGTRFTDVPLVLAYGDSGEGTGKRIGYTYVFSNEDGGTNRAALMATYGRMTDIEGLYDVTLDRDGNAIGAEYQGFLHVTRKFEGKKEGAHPILRVSTPNSMVTDKDAAGEYRFAIPPTRAVQGEGTRERLMDAAPWTYGVMGKEWAREGMERPTNPDTGEPGDVRDYLYLEFETAEVAGRCALAWGAQIEGDDRWYWSDHGQAKLRSGAGGWGRTTIELPPRTPDGKIRRLKAKVFARGNAEKDKEQEKEKEREGKERGVRLKRVSRAFTLGADYRPRASVFSFEGDELVETEKVFEARK